MTSRRSLAALLATGGLALAAAPAVHADVAIDVAPNGAADLLWSDDFFQGAWNRSLAADGTLGAKRTVTEGEVRNIDTKIDPSGTATLLYTDGYALMTRRRSPDGTLGTATVIDPAVSIRVDKPPRLALDGQGGAVFVWVDRVNDKSMVHARRQAADGTLSPVVDLTGGYYPITAPEVAVDAQGTATVGFVRRGPDAIQTRRYFKDGTLGKLVTLSSSGKRVDALRLGVAPDGRAVFAWWHREASWSPIASFHARVRRANGYLGPLVQITSDEQDGRAGGLDVAVEDDGDALITWTELPEASITTVWVRKLGGDGQLTSPQRLTAAGSTAGEPRIEVDGAGNAVAGWRGYIDASSTYVIQTRRRAADGTLGTIGTVYSTTNHRTGTMAWDLGVADAGTATFLWQYGYPEDQIATRRRAPDGTLSATTVLPN